MVSREQNRKIWGEQYDWERGGEEWSDLWGGSALHWYWAILPRIAAFVPAERILEIAPGFGRWTHYLASQCRSLISIDLSEVCVRHCRQRFEDVPHLEFAQNDGQSLSVVPDGSIDFAFSFDSLVHADAPTLEAYVQELGRVLHPGAAAFIHHSNLAPYREEYEASQSHPDPSQRLEDSGRDHGMSAELMRRFAREAGLRCAGQELLPWSSSPRLIDCFSILVGAASPWPELEVPVENLEYMNAGAYVQNLQPLYRRFLEAAAGRPSSGELPPPRGR